MKERIETLREASGQVTYNDPLTSFLYELMRDHLPTGVVEKLVYDAANEPDEGCLFTNGWLAKYANNLADQLKGRDQLKLKRDLQKVFDDMEYSRNVLSEAEKLAPTPPSEEIEDTVLKELKEELDELPDAGEEVQDIVDHIKNSIKDLVESGMVPKDEAERLVKELDELEDLDEETSETTDDAEQKECEGGCGDSCCKETDQDCCQGGDTDGRSTK